jgi:hypothetical protein
VTARNALTNNWNYPGKLSIGPQNSILGGWLPQNQLTMVIISPLLSLPFHFVPHIPIYQCKEKKLMKLHFFILLLILVFYLKQRLTILDGELHHHDTRPENIAVPLHVVLVDLGEDPLFFLPPVQHLVTRPHPPLHCPLLRRIPHILWTLDFVGVSNVTLVGLNSLPRVQKMMQYFVENFDISVLKCRVGTLDPH